MSASGRDIKPEERVNAQVEGRYLIRPRCKPGVTPIRKLLRPRRGWVFYVNTSLEKLVGSSHGWIFTPS